MPRNGAFRFCEVYLISMEVNLQRKMSMKLEATNENLTNLAKTSEAKDGGGLLTRTMKKGKKTKVPALNGGSCSQENEKNYFKFATVQNT